MERSAFDEIIEFAINSEQEAVDAYTTASEMVKQRSVRDMLLGLAAQERGHKTKLENIDRAKVSAASVVDVPDLKISDYVDGVTVTAEMDYQDVLTVAMKREERANNLYTTLASNTDDESLKELFLFLAREEAVHKLALEKEYDEHVLTDN